MARIAVKRRSAGVGDGFVVTVDPAELRVLEELPRRLEQVLTDPESNYKVVGRLFPVTHLDDPAEEAAHRNLIGDALLEERRESLAGFRAIVARAKVGRSGARLSLSTPELYRWMHVINDMRILLATGMNISDNEWYELGPPTPEAVVDFEMLVILSDLQQVVIEALE